MVSQYNSKMAEDTLPTGKTSDKLNISRSQVSWMFHYVSIKFGYEAHSGLQKTIPKSYL